MSVSKSLVGSSRIKRLGSPNNKRSSCSLLFCPPDKSETGVCNCKLVKPSCSISCEMPTSFLFTVNVFFSRAISSKILWSPNSSSSKTSWLRIAGTTVFPSFTLPEVGCSCPRINRSSVVFPAPFGPTSPIRSPGPKRRVTLSKICCESIS
ncbi:unannotated protein [freshwater metagenome]|uniref:Unannotated protein n=1 Tax=freshwater metagenome TaxID=449393 RepID=A0A6J6CDB9_9ZZZZ